LQNALELGRSLGARLPKEVWVLTIEAKRIGEFSEQLSPPVEAAVPLAADKVLELLANGAGGIEDHDLT
jgi:Ni,Fe-hydrogenase maturation factor